MPRDLYSADEELNFECGCEFRRRGLIGSPELATNRTEIGLNWPLTALIDMNWPLTALRSV